MDKKKISIVINPHNMQVNRARKSSEQAKTDMEYCNFTNCDLSYIERFLNISLKGSNFSNTSLDVFLHESYNLDIKDVIFSKEMEYEVRNNLELIDIHTVVVNSHIFFDSLEIYEIVKNSLIGKSLLGKDLIISGATYTGTTMFEAINQAFDNYGRVK